MLTTSCSIREIDDYEFMQYKGIYDNDLLLRINDNNLLQHKGINDYGLFQDKASIHVRD